MVFINQIDQRNIFMIYAAKLVFFLIYCTFFQKKSFFFV